MLRLPQVTNEIQSGSGKRVRYFRSPFRQKKIRLHANPGTPEFLAEYIEVSRTERQSEAGRQAGKTKRRSKGALKAWEKRRASAAAKA
jgi:hypothetical protein